MDDTQNASMIIEQLLKQLRKIFKKQKSECKELKHELHQLKRKYGAEDKSDVKSNHKKKKRPSEFTSEQKKKIASRQRWVCNICKDLLDYNYQIDHKNPLHSGGSSDISNGQALCPDCHIAKSKRDDNKRAKRLKSK